jgi:hypothetical protein
MQNLTRSIILFIAERKRSHMHRPVDVSLYNNVLKWKIITVFKNHNFFSILKDQRPARLLKAEN